MEDPTTGGCWYYVRVEGKIVGRCRTAHAAAALGMKYAKIGDRFDIHLGKRNLGMYIRTKGGYVAVPKGQEKRIAAIPHDQIKDFVEKQYQEKKGAKFPWELLLAAGAGAMIL